MDSTGLILNTLPDDVIAHQLQSKLAGENVSAEIIDTYGMKISHCMGCNRCFLKTPGVCAIKDDYVQILRRLAHSNRLWLVSDTRFGFLNSNGKKVMDRILPLLNMGLEFRDGQMRHTLRYGKLSVGLIYKGDGNQPLLDFWCERASMNLGGSSLGAYSSEKIGEVKVCM